MKTNACVLNVWDSRSEPLITGFPQRLLLLLQFPFLFILLWDKHDTRSHECYTKKINNYPQQKREFFEKITGEADSNNRLTQVRNHFANKFFAFIPDNYHQIDGSIKNNRCQENLRGGR